MARDFRAKQIRTFAIIGSGSNKAAQKPELKLAFYPQNTALNSSGDFQASFDLNDTTIGDDVWCVFGKKTGLGPRGSGGSEADPNFPNPNFNTESDGGERADGSSVLFTGNVVVSGSLYAERQIIEVDNTVPGHFYTPNTSENRFAGGFGSSGVTILSNGDSSFDGFVQTNTIKNHASQNLTIDTVTNGDIILTAAGGDIKFRAADQAHDIFNFSVGTNANDSPTFTIFDDSDVDGNRDYYKVTVGTGGSTNIATHDDSDANGAHLTTTVEGNITWRSDTGTFIFKDNAAEMFKVVEAGGHVVFSGLQGGTPSDILTFENSLGNATAPSILVDTNKKLKFHSDGSFIHAPANGKLLLASSFNGADGIKIDSTNAGGQAGGGIDIDSGTNGITANADGTIALETSAGSINMTSAEHFNVDATTGAGRVDLNAGTGGVLIDSTGGPISIDTTYNHANAVNITTNGGENEKIRITNVQGTTEASGVDGAILISSLAGGISLDAHKRINLDANGGLVNITDNQSSAFKFDAPNSKLTVFSAASADDGFNIDVDANGVTTLETVDGDGDLADLTLKADGILYLESNGLNGMIGLKNNGVDQLRVFLASTSGADDVFFSTGNGHNIISLVDARVQTGDTAVKIHGTKPLQFNLSSVYIKSPSNHMLEIKTPKSVTIDTGGFAGAVHAGTGTRANSGALLLSNTGIHIGGAGNGTGVASVSTGGTSPIRIFKATENVYGASNNTNPGGRDNWPFDGENAGHGGLVAQAGDLVISNRTSLNGQSANGNIIFDGSVAITDTTITNLTITGNLEVQGTTTTLNSTTTQLKDPVIMLGGRDDGAAPVSDDNKDRGIKFLWTSDDTNVTSGNFEVGEHYVITAVNSTDFTAAGAASSNVDVEFQATGVGGGGGGTAKKFHKGFMGYDDSRSRFSFIPNSVEVGETFTGTYGDIGVSMVTFGSTANAHSRIEGIAGTGDLKFTSDEYIFECGPSSGEGVHIQSDQSAGAFLDRKDSTISNGNVLGGIEFRGTGDNSSTFNEGAVILARAQENWDPASTQCATRLEFLTRASGGNIATRMRLSQTGDLQMVGTNEIQFGDAQTHIKQAQDGHLELEADVNLILDSPEIDLCDDGVVLKFGVHEDVTLTHVHNSGLLLNSSRRLQFGDSGTYIQQSADSILKLRADGQILMSSHQVVIQDNASSNESTSPTLTLRTLDAGTNDGAVLKFEKAPTGGGSIVSGENLGEIYWYGANNDFSTSYAGAAIIAEAANDWVDGSNHRTNLKFGTTSASGAPGEDMVILHDGKVGIGTVTPNAHLDVLSTSTQQRWSYDAGGTPSFATMTVANQSHTTLATGESGNFTLDAGGDIELNADGDHVSIKFGGAAGQIDFTQTNSGDGVIQQKVDGKDLLFRQFDGHTVVRIGDDRRLYFYDKGGEYITGNGTDLTIASGRDIILTPAGTEVTINNANAQLNFSNNATKIYRDSSNSNKLTFEDATVTAKTLADLAVRSTDDDSGAWRGVDGHNNGGGSPTLDKARSVYTVLFDYDGTDDGENWLDDHAGTRHHFYVKSSNSNYDLAGIESHLDLRKTLSIKDSSATPANKEAIFSQDDDFTRFGHHAGDTNTTTPASRTIQKIMALKPGGAGVGGLFLEQNQSLFFSNNSADTAVNIQRVLHTVEGNASQKCMQHQGHILPQADNTFNLGTADRRFANLYTGDLHLSNMGSGNDVDGTSGNWTIQEGEDNLYVINNLTGKKFKMMLQPVEDGE